MLSTFQSTAPLAFVDVSGTETHGAPVRGSTIFHGAQSARASATSAAAGSSISSSYRSWSAACERNQKSAMGRVTIAPPRHHHYDAV